MSDAPPTTLPSDAAGAPASTPLAGAGTGAGGVSGHGGIAAAAPVDTGVPTGTAPAYTSSGPGMGGVGAGVGATPGHHDAGAAFGSAGTTHGAPGAADHALPAGNTPLVPADHPQGGGGFLQQARDMAKPYIEQVDKTTRPYLEKAQASAKPYTDAAIAKGQELKTYLEGEHGEDGVARSHPEAGVAGVHDPAAAPGTAGAAGATGPTAADKAKGMLSYGLGSMKSAFNQLGETIDSKTATPEKPGLFTQASSAASKGLAQLQNAVGQPGATGADGAAHPAGYDAHSTGYGAHPVQTTTNTVPHLTNENEARKI